MKFKKTKKANKPNLNFLDVIGILDRLGLRRKNSLVNGEVLAWCIFHVDGKVPNLSIRQDQGGKFRCFSCGATGNILHIIEKQLGLSRSAAWDWVEGKGLYGATPESVLRALQRRSEDQAAALIASAEHIIDSLFLLIQRNVGYNERLRKAEADKNVDLYFSLVDPDECLLIDAIEYLYIYKYKNNLEFLIRGGDSDALEDLREEARDIWKLASSIGFLQRHAVRFVPTKHHLINKALGGIEDADFLDELKKTAPKDIFKMLTEPCTTRQACVLIPVGFLS